MSRDSTYDYEDYYDDDYYHGGFIKTKRKHTEKVKRKGHQTRSQNSERKMWSSIVDNDYEKIDYSYEPKESTSHSQESQAKIVRIITEPVYDPQTQFIDSHNNVYNFADIYNVTLFTKEYQGAPSYALKLQFDKEKTNGKAPQIIWYKDLDERNKMFHLIISKIPKHINTNSKNVNKSNFKTTYTQQNKEGGKSN